MALILGIETSCDETAAALVADGRYLRCNVVASQMELHARYGGIVPEVAARQHLLTIIPVVEQALHTARVSWEEVTAIAVTAGPGLAGSLLVGLNAAKALAFARGLPLLGINHLEGHIYANWLVEDGVSPEPPQPQFPLLCLVVSGGHTDLLLMPGHGQYRSLGRSRDDAAGEAFDKVARILGLGFPGGPAIQRVAQEGNPAAYSVPRAWLPGSDDFSFSGMKTAMLRLAAPGPGEPGSPPGPLIADLAASFQQAMAEVLVTKTVAAARREGVSQILLAGGVAANLLLRRTLEERAPLPLAAPPPRLCTDNAAMIAACGYYRWQGGQRDGWDLDVRPNLSLFPQATP